MSDVTDSANWPLAGKRLPEVYGPPQFATGQRVRALVPIRNDGTLPGADRGEFVVEAGDVGYVAGIGDFLQRYYVYTIDFVSRGRLVGMRGNEIERMED
ncbi:MAG: nitrogen fixation protein NifZ [Rhodospirillales bacterium]|nr:nitrogen fixation protein NifZ [Rhodospirillales bacterium]